LANPHLNDLAALNASLLARLDQTPPPRTIADLADNIGRAATNVSKSLAKLRAAGLVDGEQQDVHELTDKGREELARVRHLLAGDDAGEAAPTAAGEPVTWSQIAPSPLNPRKDFDSEEAQAAIAELAESIADEGLLQNLVVKPTTRTEEGIQFYEIVAGERRWRAIGLLVEAGRWPADRPVLAEIRAVTDLQHRQLALAENLKRRNLNPIEEAKAFQGLVEAGIKTADLAKAVNVSQRMIQQRLQLLDLPEAVQEDVAAGTMTIEQGRKEAQALNALKLDLEPPVLLALAELAVKIATDPMAVESDYRGDLTEVDDTTGGDPNFQVLNVIGLVYFRHRFEDGNRSSMRLGWNAERRLLHTVPVLDLGSPASLTQLRLAVLLSQGLDHAEAERQSLALHVEGRWLTSWLNDPFTLSPEAQAEIDEKARETAERKAENERMYEANVAARKAAEAARASMAPRAVTLVGDVLRGQAMAPPPNDFAEVFAAYGNPLPWSVHDTGEVQNADGELFGRQFHPGDDDATKAYGMLRLIAVNAAAGFKTPPLIITPKPEAAEDEADGPDAGMHDTEIEDDDQVETEDEDQLEDA